MDRGRIGIAMSKGPKRLSESPRRFQWTDELVELLGKIPDTEVAQRAGVSCTTVLAERQRRGLPSFDRRRPLLARGRLRRSQLWGQSQTELLQNVLASRLAA
jgi:hypothetical protein